MVLNIGDYITRYKQQELASPTERIVLADPERVGLVFWMNGGAASLLVNPGSSWDAGNGIAIPATGTLEFWWGRHGQLVQEDWTLFAMVAPYTFRWAEIVYKGK